jgi:hypothetical protein
MVTAIGLEDADRLRDGYMERVPLVVLAHLPDPETTVGPDLMLYGGHSDSRRAN